MSEHKPCGRCERELLLSDFDHPDVMFCSACTQEAVEIMKRKYGVIEAAHFRAKLRYSTKRLREKKRPATV